MEGHKSQSCHGIIYLAWNAGDVRFLNDLSDRGSVKIVIIACSQS